MAVNGRVGVAVIGCGRIGRRRATEATADPRSAVRVVVDPVAEAAAGVAAATGAAVEDDWRRAVERPDVDVVCVATPNAFLRDISIAALEAGKAVLVEKPMGRDLAEAAQMEAVARRSGRPLKVGFNHRYHPAIVEARRLFATDEIGRLVNVRCRYGHGGRPGQELEWRGSREMAGGGHLTDQGVHLIDLIHWFAGRPHTAYAVLQEGVWPLGGLEDNAFGILQCPNGVVAALHTGLTQWKNLFSFEVFGTTGALVIDGLGGSYGPETLTVYHRRSEGGAPREVRQVYTGDDVSWRLEWQAMLAGLSAEGPGPGTAEDGLVVMQVLDGLYRSAKAGQAVAVPET